mgnify:CR=1 FL=1
MTQIGQDSLDTRDTLSVNGQDYTYFSLAKAAKLGDVSRLPFTLKVLLENMLRFEDGGASVSTEDAQAVVDWQKEQRSDHEIQYRPARVLMQDFTGVPAVVDLAAMRDGIKALGGDAEKINPQVPVHLVIDHSVMVDEFGTPQSFEANVEREYERNLERYQFLKWGSRAFDNFQVVPPGTGICHQVNLEYIGKGAWTSEGKDGKTYVYPDTLVGTDSHTTMINGLGVLGWGVGGIEAEAAMLGQPVSMLIPEVVGFRLTGKLAEGITATDLVLTVVQMLREKGVVGRFVEFYGPGVGALTLADRATIANMAPEYGATCGFFAIDDKTLEYMRLTGRDDQTIAVTEAYAKAQGYWRPDMAEPTFTDTLELDLAAVVPSISGPKRPQDRILLSEGDTAFAEAMAKEFGKAARGFIIAIVLSLVFMYLVIAAQFESWLHPVTIMSSRVNCQCLAALIAASTLQIEEYPRLVNNSASPAFTPRRSSARRPAGVLNATSSWSVALSEIPTIRSVLVTLWIRGTCLSPMPWML